VSTSATNPGTQSGELNEKTLLDSLSHFTSPDRPTWDLYSACVHCGLCLNQCPTYRVLGLEMDSPRGRIYQILQVDAGRLQIGDAFVTHIDRCLGCRACETACPSGVQYGRIVERARTEIEKNYRRPILSRWTRSYFYKKVLTDFDLLARWAKVLRWYQRSGLQKFLRKSGALKLFRASELDALSPQVEEKFFFSEFGAAFPAEGQPRARVAFLAGCIANVAFAELNRATIRVLQKNGVAVLVPAGQGCCGALHAHAGYRDEARALARRNIDAMLHPALDAVVTNAAGCGATLKEYDDLLASDPAYAAKSRQFAEKVKDVTEFLAALGLRPPRKKIQARVTYQDPCHLAHGQRIRTAPRDLLKAVAAEVVEMPHPDFCCGSAGTYNVVQNSLSMQILESKMDDVAGTWADIVATANVGCMLQLRAGVRSRRLHMEVKHVVELLDQAYQEPVAKSAVGESARRN
jgi:glycolate oxidase iron-sulfur subunit